jgi:biotin synthase
MSDLVKKICRNRDLPDNELAFLLESASFDQALFAAAAETRRQAYGLDVYIRGLIEFSNYCRNNCLYCGIRRDNKAAVRYRLSREEILACCDTGYALGFRTFVLQSGEDPLYTDELICSIVSGIKEKYGDCAVTLSLGERPRESYQAFFDAGADRYLLRHETADPAHYAMLHPQSMSLENRKNCLWSLKEIGYQTGSGFMVGSPYQTTEHLVRDIRFLQELEPAMIGIGPYIPHMNTPFRGFPGGGLALCLRVLAVLRLMFPLALLPATTALGTVAPDGRERGLLAGANVVMPNLSPVQFRKLYELYDNKICTGEEAAECRGCLDRRVLSTGCRIVVHRGDVRTENRYGIAKEAPVPIAKHA